ncbi:MAG: RidA family protein [Dehalococcoidia bacterium]
MSTVSERLTELGIELPAAAPPAGLYNPAMVHGSVAYVSGQVPSRDGELMYQGKVGAEVDVEPAQAAARQCVLNGLAALAMVLGSVDRVERIVKMTVFVASAPGFTAQPQVANGASQVLIDIFGMDQRPARSAIGVAELPMGVPVEVELIAAISR